MTDLARIRKVGIMCAAASLATILSGCDSRNLSETFAAIKAIRVDDSPGSAAQAQDKAHAKLNGDDLKLVVSTAKDLTVGKGGLLAGGTPRRVPIDVVDPLKMPPPDDGGPIRVLPADIAAAARLQAAHDLPDIPVETATADASTTQTAVVQTDSRLIQVGSFSSIGAARQAWDALQEHHPVALRYKARFQPVTTADGRAMVRLKVGPVADGQAEALCQALSVRDTWCARAG